MARKALVLDLVAGLFSVISLILIMIILLAGSNNMLSGLYYLKVDTTFLSVPSKLSSSEFLRDLSTISAKDLTGADSTASSLGLADTYTLPLLSACAISSTSTSCSAPSINFNFDPATTLHLDGTALQGTYPPSLLSALASYRRAKTFTAGAYIAAAAALALAPALSLLLAARRQRSRGGIAATALAGIAAALLLAGSVTAAVVFGGLRSQLDSAFASAGLSSQTGAAPVALGFVAAVCAVIAAVALWRSGQAANAGPMRGLGDVKGKAYDDGVVARKQSNLWKRISSFGSHNYVQIEKQPALVQGTAGVAGPQTAAILVGQEGETRLHDEDWTAENEFVGSGNVRNESGDRIPMLSMGHGATKMQGLNTAYEPYTSTSA